MSRCEVMSGECVQGTMGTRASVPLWKMGLMATPVLKLQRPNENHHLLKLVPRPSLSYIMPPFPVEDCYLYFPGGEIEAVVHSNPSSGMI